MICLYKLGGGTLSDSQIKDLQFWLAQCNKKGLFVGFIITSLF
jgi:hypothetical protein